MNDSLRDDSCPLCVSEGGAVLWRNDVARVVLVDDPDYPGFVRIILNRHHAEWSDLTDAEREQTSRLLLDVERLQRDILQPDKINLASLGNVVPHVHWHLIPRYRNDAHFPQPIWAARQREVASAILEARRAAVPALAAAVRAWPAR